MSGYFKYIVIRVVLVGNLLLLFNLVYESLIWRVDLEKHAPYALELEAASQSAEILYLGDCSDGFFYKNDATSIKISQYLDSLLPSKVAGISRDGFHAGVYCDLVSLVPDSHKLEKIIVTLNMRAFSPPILLSEHENKLEKQRVILKKRPPMVNRFLLAFKGYPHLTGKELEQAIHQKWNKDTLLFSPGADIKTLQEWREQVIKDQTLSKEEKRNHLRFIENYGFTIEEGTMTQDLDELIKVAEGKGIELIFHLLPEDVERAHAIDSQLVQSLQAKRAWLIKRYSGKVKLIDNFELFTKQKEGLEGFAIPLPSSHYSAFGREKIAQAIAIDL